MSKYRPIHKKIWKDKDFKKSCKDSKLLFLYLVTNDSINNSGIYEMPLSVIAHETSITKNKIKKLLTNNNIKNIRYDMTNEIVFVVNSRKYFPGGNPAQVEKGIISEFKETSKTFLWLEFLKLNPQFKDKFPTVAQPLPNGSLPIPLPLKDLKLNKEPLSKNEKQSAFDERWLSYPGKKDGKKKANGHWNAAIKNNKDIAIYDSAIKNYHDYVLDEQKYGFKSLQYKNGGTWFNNWTDWIPEKSPVFHVPQKPEKLEKSVQPKEPVDPELEKLWADVKAEIKQQLSPDSFDRWFQLTSPKCLINGCLEVVVPNQLIRKALTEIYRPLIETTLGDILDIPILVEISVGI